jgi:hypothetical protein
MKKFNTPAEAFASQNYDPSAVKIEGVPAQHLEAAKAFINLCVAHDAVNPEFQPDFTDYDQDKFEVDHEMGSPSGAGFAYYDYAYWIPYSSVGSRLVSESSDAAEHIAELFHDDFKAMKVYERKIEK